MAASFIVKFNSDRCKGCELCRTVCPRNIITTSSHVNSKGYFTVAINEDDQKICIGCASCAQICPDCAIEIFREEN